MRKGLLWCEGSYQWHTFLKGWTILYLYMYCYIGSKLHHVHNQWWSQQVSGTMMTLEVGREAWRCNMYVPLPKVVGFIVQCTCRFITIIGLRWEWPWTNPGMLENIHDLKLWQWFTTCIFQISSTGFGIMYPLLPRFSIQ